jgi:hypothetical protein
VLEGPYSDEEIDAAVAALTAPDRLAGAQDAVARVAPQLQRVLDDALDAGGWFGQAHETEVSKAATIADADHRRRAVRTLIAEETGVSMLIGVAVGYELAHLLMDSTEGD